MSEVEPIDYSVDNLTQPVIQATIDLPPREPVRQHRKIIEPRAQRRRRAEVNDDDDDGSDHEEPEVERVQFDQAGVGAGPGNNFIIPAFQPVVDRPVVDQPPDATPGILWRIVSRLQWRNRSDGPPPNNAAAALIRGLTADEKVMFVREYNENLGATVVALTNIFAARNIVQPADKLRITSHVIAMGREQYRTFMEDVTLFEFLIDCDETQSFDSAIRPYL